MSTSSEKNETAMPWLNTYPKDIEWDAPLNIRPVYEILEETCENYGDRPAFDFMGRKWKWADIGEMVDKMACGLQYMGIGKGTKVGLFLPNCTYFLVAYYAILKTGATIVNYNPLYAKEELRHQIEDSETSIMITLDLKALYDNMYELMSETCIEKLIVCRFIDLLPFPKDVAYWALKNSTIAKIPKDDRCIWFHYLISNDGSPEKVDIDPEEDVAVFQYTGGTTGVPKGAMLTHANISANVEQAVMWFNDAQIGKERMLGVLPFFHAFAMTAVMNMSVRCAFEIIALPRFDMEETLKLIQSKKPHYFPAIPPIYNAINNFKQTKKYNLKSLRYCISGGSTLPAEVKKSFEGSTGCVLIEGYGLSESSPVATANPIEGANKFNSIGQPLPGTTLEIISTEDKKTAVPQGKRGEICIRGPQVMKGYWNSEEATNEILVDGLLYTGDVGFMDSDGYFYVVDRIKDIIITNGYNVYPRNVEESIYLHPHVAECIVAGIEDPSRGEIVKAWVKLKDGSSITEKDLKEFLQDKLSKIEMPRRIIIRDKPIPKTTIGKLSRKLLLEELAEEAANKEEEETAEKEPNDENK
jgi:long-chain acyl-CoA synthetase